jgi:hypothetical protein
MLNPLRQLKPVDDHPYWWQFAKILHPDGGDSLKRRLSRPTSHSPSPFETITQHLDLVCVLCRLRLPQSPSVFHINANARLEKTSHLECLTVCPKHELEYCVDCLDVEKPNKDDDVVESLLPVIPGDQDASGLNRPCPAMVCEHCRKRSFLRELRKWFLESGRARGMPRETFFTLAGMEAQYVTYGGTTAGEAAQQFLDLNFMCNQSYWQDRVGITQELQLLMIAVKRKWYRTGHVENEAERNRRLTLEFRLMGQAPDARIDDMDIRGRYLLWEYERANNIRDPLDDAILDLEIQAEDFDLTQEAKHIFQADKSFS